MFFMELKSRLQRVLQIVEETERTGAMSDLERDIVLGELREAYAEVKFGVEVCEKQEKVVASTFPTSEPETEESEEPEMEIEILFNEEEEEETTVAEESVAEPVAEESAVVEESAIVEKSAVVEKPAIVEEPAVVEKSAVAETPNAPNAPNASNASNAPKNSNTPATPAPKRSPLLSLYEEDAPVLGEQFREAPSVADVISRPKGLAESAPLSSLRDAIGVADKFMLIRELFDGDSEAYDNAIDSLENIGSFDDCVIYIAENYSWRAQSEATKYMMSLLQRKFNE